MSDIKITEWTLKGVLDEIKNSDANMRDRHYAFILGAGASKSSNIDTGHELAQRWLKEIHQRECLDSSLTLDAWLASGDHSFGDTNISYAEAGSFYPVIFERRFHGDREAGYAALEDAIEGKIPSLGYSLLASIIQQTRHKVVITTNFDNLVADALSMQAHQSPLIVAHESLAGFVRPNLRRPLVAKIHRDLFFNPKNDHEGVSKMEESWREALKKIFQHYTPIVIGYGGNDGSLMDMLNDLPEGSIAGRIIWCCRNTSNLPEKAVNVLEKHKGIATQISGFDELMLQLAEKLIPSFIVGKIPDNLEGLGKKRADDYRKQIEKITASSSDITAKQIILSSAENNENWWSWQLKIDDEKNSNKQRRLYNTAIKKFPRSPELHYNYAIFLRNICKDYESAEKHYKIAIEISPNDASANGNYAILLDEIGKNYDKAEFFYRKAIELAPENASHTGNYALFLEEIRKDYNSAEIFFKKSIDLDPIHINNNSNYATFLDEIRNDPNSAIKYYKKAIKLDPNNISVLANYSSTLIRNKNSESSKLVENYTKKIITLTKEKTVQALAESLFYAALARELFPLTIKVNFISRLKNIIRLGFEREKWSFEHMFEAVLPELSKEKQKFYRALGDAILDEKKVSELENFSEWADCDEIDVFADFEE